MANDALASARRTVIDLGGPDAPFLDDGICALVNIVRREPKMWAQRLMYGLALARGALMPLDSDPDDEAQRLEMLRRTEVPESPDWLDLDAPGMDAARAFWEVRAASGEGAPAGPDA